MSNNDGSDKEWERIMSNPENVIMSESLINKVDPYDLGDIEPTVHLNADCELVFTDYNVVGTIIGFHNVKDIMSYTLLVPTVETYRMFSKSSVQSIRIYSYEETYLVREYSDTTVFDYEVEIESGENSILTISFPAEG